MHKNQYSDLVRRTRDSIDSALTDFTDLIIEIQGAPWSDASEENQCKTLIYRIQKIRCGLQDDLKYIENLINTTSEKSDV